LAFARFAGASRGLKDGSLLFGCPSCMPYSKPRFCRSAMDGFPAPECPQKRVNRNVCADGLPGRIQIPCPENGKTCPMAL